MQNDVIQEGIKIDVTLEQMTREERAAWWDREYDRVMQESGLRMWYRQFYLRALQAQEPPPLAFETPFDVPCTTLADLERDRAPRTELPTPAVASAVEAR